MDFEKQERDVRVRLADQTLVWHRGKVEEHADGSITIRDKKGDNIATLLKGEFSEWFYDDTDL